MYDAAQVAGAAFNVSPLVALIFVGIGAVLWHLTKRSIESNFAAQVEELKSRLLGVETEARQLRDHALGLEAERRKRFEAKRSELAAELYGAFVACRRLERQGEQTLRLGNFLEGEPSEQEKAVDAAAKLAFERASRLLEDAALYLRSDTLDVADRFLDLLARVRGRIDESVAGDLDDELPELRTVMQAELVAASVEPEDAPAIPPTPTERQSADKHQSDAASPREEANAQS